MLKRLERDAAKADLATVEALLSARNSTSDPVGFFQYSRRLEEIKRQISEIDASPDSNAEVGLFFGGRPVFGSFGIQADFGAKALSEFQTLVSSAYAASDGELATRGPVPQRDRTQLFLTDLARGSLGFVLQQVDDPQLFNSTLKDNMDHIIDLVFRVASPDQESFEKVTEEVDRRVLNSLKSFFRLMDEAGATLRIVEDKRDFTLNRDEISLARERTEKVTFEEIVEQIRGTIYVLPLGRRFELHPKRNQNLAAFPTVAPVQFEMAEGLIRGAVAPDCMVAITSDGTEVKPGILGQEKLASLRVRTVMAPGADSKKSYTLLSISDIPTQSLLLK